MDKKFKLERKSHKSAIFSDKDSIRKIKELFKQQIKKAITGIVVFTLFAGAGFISIGPIAHSITKELKASEKCSETIEVPVEPISTETNVDPLREEVSNAMTAKQVEVDSNSDLIIIQTKFGNCIWTKSTLFYQLQEKLYKNIKTIMPEFQDMDYDFISGFDGTSDNIQFCKLFIKKFKNVHQFNEDGQIVLKKVSDIKVVGTLLYDKNTGSLTVADTEGVIENVATPKIENVEAYELGIPTQNFNQQVVTKSR